MEEDSKGVNYKLAKFVELYCDEMDKLWKITIWTVSTKDFDPFECHFENYSEIQGNTVVEYAEPNVHKATTKQREIANALRRSGEQVHINTNDPNSFFQIVPKWIIDLIHYNR